MADDIKHRLALISIPMDSAAHVLFGGHAVAPGTTRKLLEATLNYKGKPISWREVAFLSVSHNFQRRSIEFIVQCKDFDLITLGADLPYCDYEIKQLSYTRKRGVMDVNQLADAPRVEDAMPTRRIVPQGSASAWD